MDTSNFSNFLMKLLAGYHPLNQILIGNGGDKYECLLSESILVKTEEK